MQRDRVRDPSLVPNHQDAARAVPLIAAGATIPTQAWQWESGAAPESRRQAALHLSAAYQRERIVCGCPRAAIAHVGSGGHGLHRGR